MTSPSTPVKAGHGRPLYVVASTAILLASLSGLLYYKWGGALHTLAKVQSAQAWSGTADALTTGALAARMEFYFRRIWLALVYGLLIGSAVCAFLSPRRIVALTSGGPARRRVAGGLVGAPLMLCSCCITPIFQGVYEQGAPLGSALSLMLASPGLNPAALLVTFLLFPAPLAVARLIAGMVIVFGVPPLLEAHAGGTLPSPRARNLPQPASAFGTPFGGILQYARALGYLVLRTVPLVLVGVLISSAILPATAAFTSAGAAVAVCVVATGAVLVALPTFFEIPLALVFLRLGLPGPALALLVAGPIVNLPSLLIVGRETRPRVAFELAAAVWMIAVAAGLLVSA